MGYTYYNPLKVWLDPASIADVVSYMQKYLSENPIKNTEEINQIIADYIAAHPEIIGGVQSVNGETGVVVLTASDINTTGQTTIQAVLTSLSSQISDIAQTVAQNTNDITDLKSNFDGIASPSLTGSFYDFSNYINKPLFGESSMFAGSGTYFVMDISDLDLSGKTISTYIWIDSQPAFIDGYIVEVQLDSNGNQIFPSSGYHYAGHPMTILNDCKSIRLFATANAYNAWTNATVIHAQLYTTGSEQVNYTVKYSVDNMATTESVETIKNAVGAEEIVTSNTKIDPSDAIGKTFGSVNDSVYLFPFGKTLAEIGSGYTNFKVYLNSGSISGYFQLVKADGTTDNGNYSFNTTTYNLDNVVNPNLVRGIKIHCYSAASGIEITSLAMTFNGATVDTFATGLHSNINPSSWGGKKWIAYGDSITYGGVWERIVVQRTGLLLTNAGLASSCVADVDGATVASFTNADRISALPTNADVVTIMGGTNDYGNNVPIGDIPTTTPYDKTTFIGALCETIKLIQTQCPNALIVIMSNVGGRGTTGVSGDIPPRNTIGISSSDYAEGAEKVASFMGCPFIDVHRCGINPINRTLYIADAVHPNEAGSKLIARKVIDYLINNYPL